VNVYIVVLPTTHVLKLPPYIYQPHPQLALKQLLQLVPNHFDGIDGLDFVENGIGDRHAKQLAGCGFTHGPALFGLESPYVTGGVVCQQNSGIGEMVAETSHLDDPLHAIAVRDPVGSIGEAISGVFRRGGKQVSI